jgi:hypothetical protein
VRLDILPGDAPVEKPQSAKVSLPGRDESFDAEILGTSPVADPQIQAMSFIAVLRNQALPAGVTLRARLAGTGEPQKGLTVPRSAIVYHQGSAWVYVLGEEDLFERKLVTIGRSVGKDVTVTSGVDSDDQIVTTGAQQLLAAELQAGGSAEES